MATFLSIQTPLTQTFCHIFAQHSHNGLFHAFIEQLICFLL
ncbi:hypothetical protein [uncultured Gammaproteobacteria bacterium]|nr:hypothetical protein BROOK1789B_1565 [Bathymodiolus brooksi thiotrophic gill symbiont]CAC9549517.1 hypothetical protein [uncultured Gammaproteobacteria bacterium]CAC9953972.1 hypothetical protein [uncultured Gammaproteobacteria bacterium]CAC9986118.1 hypothetical protein [uncultured Gammaproteobacteria bacterium]